MKPWTRDFLDLALRCQALRFGCFELKSGRRSPYFFNAGCFADGAALSELSRCYAQAICASDLDFDLVFGPAYKGIPLAAAVAVSLHRDHRRNVGFAYNRKETKDHGEGGRIVGAALHGEVLIVDDVVSAGTSVRESMHWVGEHGARTAGVAIALDRQERGAERQSAVTEIEAAGVRVIRIATLADLIAWITEQAPEQADLSAMLAYRERYGCP